VQIAVGADTEGVASDDGPRANRAGAVTRVWGPFKRGPATGPARVRSGPLIEAGPLGPAGAGLPSPQVGALTGTSPAPAAGL
jgi:hypothetical protein